MLLNFSASEYIAEQLFNALVPSAPLWLIEGGYDNRRHEHLVIAWISISSAAAKKDCCWHYTRLTTLTLTQAVDDDDARPAYIFDCEVQFRRLS